MALGTANRNSYVGTGLLSTYAYTFRIFAATDLYVVKRDTSNVETVLTYPTDYSVSGLSPTTGGTIQLTAGNLPAGYVLTISRNRPKSQNTDYRSQSIIYPEIIEQSLDNLHMLVQDLDSRVIKTSPTDSSKSLPYPNAGFLVGWDGSGNLTNFPAGSGGGGGGLGTVSRLSRFLSTTFVGDSQIEDEGGGGPVTLAPQPALISAFDWDKSKFRLGWTLNNAGSVSLSSAGEFGVHIQTKTTITTNSASSYQKTGFGVYSMTSDPSNYGAGLTRDTVAISGNARITDSNPQGRAWGGFFESGCEVGAEGLCVGIEIAIRNNGSSQPQVDTVDNKTALLMSTNLGPNPAGQAICIAADFYRGIWAREASTRISFIEIDRNDANTSIFRVKPNGQTLIGDLPNVGTLTDYTSTIYGQLGVQNMITVIDQATNKNVLVLFSDHSVNAHRIAGGRYNNTVTEWPVTLEVGSLEVLRAVNEGVMQMPDRGAVGALAPAGMGWLRYNNGAGVFEQSCSGGAWSALGAVGGAVSGSGTVNMLAKFSGSTTVVGSSTLFDDGASVLIGTVTATDSLRKRVEVEKNQNEGVGMTVRNQTSNTLAWTFFQIQSGTGSCDLLMGITSPLYTTSGNIAASTAFLKSGTSATGGLIVQSDAGSIYVRPGSSTVRATFTTDGALLMASSSASVGAGKLRFNGTNWQIDNDGSGYVNLGAGGGSGGGFQDDGTTVRLVTTTDKVVVGYSTSDISDTGVLIAKTFYAANAAADASVVALGFNGSRAVVASGLSGAGTALPLTFDTYVAGTQERMRIFVNGNVGIGYTSDAGYKLDVNGGVRASAFTSGITTNQVVYSSSGILSGSADHTWNNSTKVLAVNGRITASILEIPTGTGAVTDPFGSGFTLDVSQLTFYHAGVQVLNLGTGIAKMYIGGALKTLSVDGSGFVKAT